MNRAMTKLLTHTRMIIIRDVANIQNSILASSPVKEERGRHLTELIKL